MHRCLAVLALSLVVAGGAAADPATKDEGQFKVTGVSPRATERVASPVPVVRSAKALRPEEKAAVDGKHIRFLGLWPWGASCVTIGISWLPPHYHACN